MTQIRQQSPSQEQSADEKLQPTFRLNGIVRAWQAGQTMRALCDLLAVGERGFAVERNGEIVPRSRHRIVTAEPGDVIEIVHMVGGG